MHRHRVCDGEPTARAEVKLVAYTIQGPHHTWPDVDAWLIEGANLFLRRGTGRQMEIEKIELPEEIIGFTDDAPPGQPDRLYPKGQRHHGQGQT
jgi:hypothetical protein